MSVLKEKVLHAFKWNAIGVSIKFLLQIVFIVAITRLLSPQDFGLMAVSLAIIALGNIISDFGLGSALVQRETLNNEDIRFVFTYQIIIGFSLTIIFYTLSPIISVVLSHAETENVLKILSVVFLIQSFGLTASSLLRRDFNFKKIQKIQLYTYVFSYGFIGVSMAFYGFGVWSLVTAQISQVLTTSIWLNAQHPHSYKPLFYYSGGVNFIYFGSKSITNNLLSWIVDNSSNFFIGFFGGSEKLGYFNRSLTLVKVPMDLITASFQGVLLPLYSSVQKEKDNQRKIFLGSAAFLAMIMFPIFFAAAVVPETIVIALFGSNWVESALILTPLALAMPVNTLLALGGPVLWGNNQGGKEVIAQLYSVILILVMLYFLSQISLIVASWGVFFAFLVRFFFINSAVLYFLDSSWKEYFISIFRPILLGMVFSILVYLFDYTMSSFFSSSIVVFVFDIFIGVFIYALLMYIYAFKIIGSDLFWLIEKFDDKLPGFIKKRLQGN